MKRVLPILFLVVVVLSGCVGGGYDEYYYITVDEAFDIVMALPEVIAFSDRMKIVGQPWRIAYHGVDYFGDDLSSENSWYLFQVYEVHPTHTATFNWYHVSAKTGEVIPMF